MSPMWFALRCCLMAALLGCAVSISLEEVRALTHAGHVVIADNPEDPSNMTYLVRAQGRPPHDYGPFLLEEMHWIDIKFSIPKSPTESPTPRCLPVDAPIALASTGVPFWGPYTAEGVNAVEGPSQEWRDNCSAALHEGRSHYRTGSPCIPPGGDTDHIIGVALDGFPIYGGSDGAGLPGDLDTCHGRRVNGKYRYHVTKQFPYILGCFRGNHDGQHQAKPGRPCLFANVPHPRPYHSGAFPTAMSMQEWFTVVLLVHFAALFSDLKKISFTKW